VQQKKFNKKEIFPMKRVLSMILALTMLCAAFALTACGNTSTTTQKTLGTIAQGTGTTGTTGTIKDADINAEGAGLDIRPGFENVDFAGHTFTFASPINTTDGWADYEVYAEEDGTGILDAAIVQRNNLLIEHYDCLIKVEDVDKGTLTEDFNTNQNRIDLLLTRYNLQSKANGDYYNLNTLNIDFSKPWWDQNFIEDVTVNGKIYAMVGAFSLTSLDATWVMFFNKTVKETTEQLRDVDFYQLVYDGEWTLDKFYELLKYAALDDGDAVMTVGTDDFFGLVSSSFGIRGLYFGAGQSYVTKTDKADGTTEFSHSFNQAAVEATNKIIDIYGFAGTTVTDYIKVEAQMRSNTVLFSPEVLRYAATYAGKQGTSTQAVDIGILPHPALNEEMSAAKEYNSVVLNHQIYLCVPRTCSDLTRIAQFLEVYAYHSYYTVYKEYLDLYKYTYTTDVDSAEMVDIILKSRSFDLAYHLSWTGIDGEYLKGVQNGSNVVSELGAAFGKAIVTAANAYRDNMKGANS
jgi:hypothetical protein